MKRIDILVVFIYYLMLIIKKIEKLSKIYLVKNYYHNFKFL